MLNDPNPNSPNQKHSRTWANILDCRTSHFLHFLVLTVHLVSLPRYVVIWKPPNSATRVDKHGEQCVWPSASEASTLVYAPMSVPNIPLYFVRTSTCYYLIPLPSVVWDHSGIVITVFALLHNEPELLMFAVWELKTIFWIFWSFSKISIDILFCFVEFYMF